MLLGGFLLKLHRNYTLLFETKESYKVNYSRSFSKYEKPYYIFSDMKQTPWKKHLEF
jgi:hypothetical protein